MKRTLALLSLATLCTSAVILGGGFGSAQLGGGAPFTLTVKNSTKDVATVTAFYGTEGKTLDRAVDVGGTRQYSIPKDKLTKVVITAGSTTETVTEPFTSQSREIIKR
jgi:hypothetical protein